MLRRWSILIGLALMPVVSHGQYFMIPAERQTPSELEQPVSSASSDAASSSAPSEIQNPPSMMVPAPNASSSASSAPTPRSDIRQLPPSADVEVVPITNTTPLPQPSPVVPIKIAPKLPSVNIFVRVTSPKGGETVELKKSATQYIRFTYGGPLEKTSGNYRYRIELLQHGKLLGNIMPLGSLQLDPHTSEVTYGEKPGAYLALKPGTDYKESRIALPGGGYQFRVTLLQAVTPPGEATVHKELASDTSDGTFSYVSVTEPPTVTKFEPLSVTVTKPSDGEVRLLSASIEYITFTYGGSLDKTSGNYRYRIELLQHGKLLGNIMPLGSLQLDPHTSEVTYGEKPGAYLAVKPGTDYKESRIALPGGGYQFRVTLLQATTPPGEATVHKELASDTSDGTFSYVTSVRSAVIRASELENIKSTGEDTDVFVVISGGETLPNTSVLLPFASRLREAESVKKVTVRGWDPEKKKAILEPSSVETLEALGEHTALVALENEGIQSIDIEGTKIGIDYGVPAHLFGFIPMTITLRTSVDLADDTASRVKLQFPWYRFLVRTGVGKAEAETELKTKLKEMSEMGEMEELRLQMQMDRLSKMLSTLSNILKKMSDTASGITQNMK